MTRRDYDFYPTPTWAVGVIEHHFKDSDILLETSAGIGNILKVCRKVAKFKEIHAVEIQEDFREVLTPLADHVHIKNFFSWQPPESFNNHKSFLGIQNPPFGNDMCFNFTVKLLDIAKKFERYDVWVYANLQFMASQSRKRFINSHKFSLYPLSERPSHTEDGKTAPNDYAWFRWSSYHPVEIVSL